MAGRHMAPDGWTFQAFSFTLDPTAGQAAALARNFGGRRYAYNWTVSAMKADIDHFNATGEACGFPSFYSMRKRWNAAKCALCIDQDTGKVWWPEVCKEAFASGIRDATDAYCRWVGSRNGKIAGATFGFPRFKKKGGDPDRYTVTTGSFGIVDRRHVKIPKVGVIRTHENMRRLERLVSLKRAHILAVTIRRRGDRIIASFRVEVLRPQTNTVPALPESIVGVDAGVRHLATVAATDGTIVEVVPNPRALETAMGDLRRLQRHRARCTPGSRRYREATRRISELHTRVALIRSHHIHVLTTRLAKTHGVIGIEKLHLAGMVRQAGIPGARSRRRRLYDAALAEQARQLRYKCDWYGSRLVEADRFFPSSKTCHECGNIQNIGWSEHWTCDGCGAVHQRDENAAINLARFAAGDLSPVGAPVKQGAECKTRHHRADGKDLRKSFNSLIAQPREGRVGVANIKHFNATEDE